MIPFYEILQEGLNSRDIKDLKEPEAFMILFVIHAD